MTSLLRTTGVLKALLRSVLLSNVYAWGDNLSFEEE